MSRLTLSVVTVLALCLACGSLRAADEDASGGFEALLRRELRGTFERISDYVHEHPEAHDVEQAWRWLFTTALESGFEVEAVELAEEYQKRPAPDALTRGLAQQAQILGQARSGHSDDAVAGFTRLLRFARLQSGGALIEFGRRLATQLRLEGDPEASKAVYEEIAHRFFLNADIRHLCENHIARIDLVNKPAPEIEVNSTTGEPVRLSDLQGKVVLLDFWATNCPPCLEEMPNIIQLYRDRRDHGFEVIGVSLDADASLVASYTERAGMTWRQIVDPMDVQTLRDRYLVEKIPAMYVIDRDGKIAQFDIKGGSLRRTVDKLLKAKPSDE